MEDNGEVQEAFRRDRRTEDNIFTLQGICALRKSKKSKTFLAFLGVFILPIMKKWYSGQVLETLKISL